MVAPPACTQFIGVKGWGGYTWNTSLYEDPQAFIDLLHSDEHRLQLSLNFHPDNGVDACQKMYGEFARALGVDPATKVGSSLWVAQVGTLSIRLMPDLVTCDLAHKRYFWVI